MTGVQTCALPILFKDLLAVRERDGGLDPAAVRAATDPASRALVRFIEALPRFAFVDALGEVLTRRGASLEALRAHGPWRPILDAFLDADGLGAAQAPKGLLLFHREDGVARTAFEEHLIEAVPLTNDGSDTRTLEVTVSPEHRAGFEHVLATRAPALAECFGGRWAVAFSEQHPATDTIAGDPAGGPFRDEHGRLLFRPAGHGALLHNLGAAERDLVFLKNIDNLGVSRLKPATYRWSRALVGLAAEVSDATRALVRRLRGGEPEAVADAQIGRAHV